MAFNIGVNALRKPIFGGLRVQRVHDGKSGRCGDVGRDHHDPVAAIQIDTLFERHQSSPGRNRQSLARAGTLASKWQVKIKSRILVET